MDNNTLKLNLFAGLGPFLPTKKIWVNSGKGRPTGLYAALKLSDQETIGSETLHDVNSEGNQEVSSQKQELLTIELYGDDSYGKLKTLKEHLKSDQLRNPLAKNKIVVLRSGNVVDVSGLLGESQIEERAELEIIISYKSSITHNVGVIEVLNLIGEFGDLPLNQTIGKAINIMLTEVGGLAVKSINNTGAPTKKGYAVTASPNKDNAVEYVPVGKPNAVGFFYEEGVPVGEECWVVISGFAYVYFKNGATRGDLVRGTLAVDGDYEDGQVLSEPIPSSPFATDKHFCENGHAGETVAAGQFAKCFLHFL